MIEFQECLGDGFRGGGSPRWFIYVITEQKCVRTCGGDTM